MIRFTPINIEQADECFQEKDAITDLRALRLMVRQRLDDAKQLFEQLLAVDLVHDENDTPNRTEDSPVLPVSTIRTPPDSVLRKDDHSRVHQLRYLVYSNYAHLLYEECLASAPMQAYGDLYTRTLEFLVKAAQLSGADPVLWYRVGMLACRIRQLGLARHAFERILFPNRTGPSPRGSPTLSWPEPTAPATLNLPAIRKFTPVQWWSLGQFQKVLALTGDYPTLAAYCEGLRSAYGIQSPTTADPVLFSGYESIDRTLSTSLVRFDASDSPVSRESSPPPSTQFLPKVQILKITLDRPQVTLVPVNPELPTAGSVVTDEDTAYPVSGELTDALTSAIALGPTKRRSSLSTSQGHAPISRRSSKRKLSDSALLDSATVAKAATAAKSNMLPRRVARSSRASSPGPGNSTELPHCPKQSTSFSSQPSSPTHDSSDDYIIPLAKMRRIAFDGPCQLRRAVSMVCNPTPAAQGNSNLASIHSAKPPRPSHIPTSGGEVNDQKKNRRFLGSTSMEPIDRVDGASSAWDTGLDRAVATLGRRLGWWDISDIPRTPPINITDGSPGLSLLVPEAVSMHTKSTCIDASALAELDDDAAWIIRAWVKAPQNIRALARQYAQHGVAQDQRTRLLLQILRSYETPNLEDVLDVDVDIVHTMTRELKIPSWNDTTTPMDLCEPEFSEVESALTAFLGLCNDHNCDLTEWVMYLVLVFFCPGFIQQRYGVATGVDGSPRDPLFNTDLQDVPWLSQTWPEPLYPALGDLAERVSTSLFAFVHDILKSELDPATTVKENLSQVHQSLDLLSGCLGLAEFLLDRQIMRKLQAQSSQPGTKTKYNRYNPMPVYQLIMEFDFAWGAHFGTQRSIPSLTSLFPDLLEYDLQHNQLRLYALVSRRQWLHIKIQVVENDLDKVYHLLGTVVDHSPTPNDKAGPSFEVELPNCRFLNTLSVAIAQRLRLALANQKALLTGLEHFRQQHFSACIHFLRPLVDRDDTFCPVSTGIPFGAPRRFHGVVCNMDHEMRPETTDSIRELSTLSLDLGDRLLVWHILLLAYESVSPPNQAEIWNCEFHLLVNYLTFLRQVVDNWQVHFKRGFTSLSFPSTRGTKPLMINSDNVDSLLVVSSFTVLLTVNRMLDSLIRKAYVLFAYFVPTVGSPEVHHSCDLPTEQSKNGSVSTMAPASRQRVSPSVVLLFGVRLAQHILAYDERLRSLPETEIQVPLYTLMVRVWELLFTLRLMDELPPYRYLAVSCLPSGSPDSSLVDPVTPQAWVTEEGNRCPLLDISPTWLRSAPCLDVVNSFLDLLRVFHHRIGAIGLCTVDKASFLTFYLRLQHWDPAVSASPMDERQCLYCLYDIRLDDELEGHDCEPMAFTATSACAVYSQFVPMVADKLLRNQPIKNEWRTSLENLIEAIGEPPSTNGRIMVNREVLDEYLAMPVDFFAGLAEDHGSRVRQATTSGASMYPLPMVDVRPRSLPDAYFSVYFVQGYALHTLLRQRLKQSVAHDHSDFFDEIEFLYRHQLTITPSRVVVWYCLARLYMDRVREHLIARAHVVIKDLPNIADLVRCAFHCYTQCLVQLRSIFTHHSRPVPPGGIRWPRLEPAALANEVGQFLYFLTQQPTPMIVFTAQELPRDPSNDNSSGNSSGHEHSGSLTADVNHNLKVPDPAMVTDQLLKKLAVTRAQPPPAPTQRQVYRWASVYLARALESQNVPSPQRSPLLGTFASQATINGTLAMGILLNQSALYPTWTAAWYLGQALHKLAARPLSSYACLIKAIDLVLTGTDSYSNGQAVVDPLYTLLSALSKDLFRELISSHIAHKILGEIYRRLSSVDTLVRLIPENNEHPSGKSMAVESTDGETHCVTPHMERPPNPLLKDRERQNAFTEILNLLQGIRTMDKNRQHHKPTYRVAWLQSVIFHDFRKAEDTLGSLFNAMSLTRSFVVFYKGEYEPQGRHYYYVHKYTLFLIHLYRKTINLDGLLMLARRLKKLDSVLIAPREVAVALAINYLVTLQHYVRSLLRLHPQEDFTNSFRILQGLCNTVFTRYAELLEAWTAQVVASQTLTPPSSDLEQPNQSSMDSRGIPCEKSHRFFPPTEDPHVRILYRLFYCIVHAIKLKRINTVSECKGLIDGLIERLYVEILYTHAYYHHHHRNLESVSSQHDPEPVLSVMNRTQAASTDSMDINSAPPTHTEKTCGPSPGTPAGLPSVPPSKPSVDNRPDESKFVPGQRSSSPIQASKEFPDASPCECLLPADTSEGDLGTKPKKHQGTVTRSSLLSRVYALFHILLPKDDGKATSAATLSTAALKTSASAAGARFQPSLEKSAPDSTTEDSVTFQPKGGGDFTAGSGEVPK
ncbi:Histone transcription regulator 3 [Dispira simplex]|nr:Histone transcription regulator 3 [Dispira simplex]